MSFASWLEQVIDTAAANQKEQLRDWERTFKGELTFDQWRASVNRQHGRNAELLRVDEEKSEK